MNKCLTTFWVKQPLWKLWFCETWLFDEDLSNILSLEVRLERTLGYKMTDIQSYPQLLLQILFKIIQLFCIPNVMLELFVWLNTCFKVMTAVRQLDLVLSCDLKKERMRRREEKRKGRGRRKRNEKNKTQKNSLPERFIFLSADLNY